jgi:hypothetical protein
VAAPPIGPPRRPLRLETIPTVLPAVTVRGQMAELCWSLALAAALGALLATLWAVLNNMKELPEVANAYFLTIATCWTVLVPAKWWSGRRGDAAVRRGTMMALGLGVGLLALWLEGRGAGPTSVWTGEAPGHEEGLWLASARYLSFFGLGLFALRWWKMAERQRTQRFSLAPVLAAGFWAILLWALVWHSSQGWPSAIALIAASVIVQLVSPWEQPPPRAAGRPARLRYV